MNGSGSGSGSSRSRSCRGIIPIIEVVHHVDKKVNMIGVVVEFSLPRKSCGTDYVSTLKIVDESQQSPEFSVNIFTEKVQHLPVVKSHSDLVVLHNVMIKKHDGEVNAVFSKNFSSFALFDGKNSNDLSCYQALRSFSLSWREMNCIKNLRNWWPSARIDSGKSEYLVSVKDISSDTYFDLVCKVLHASFDVSRGLWILFVWDGSDAPLLSLDGKLKDEEKNPLPLQVESFALDQDTLSKFYHVGTILRVMADKSHENLGLQFHGVGKWVRIRNVGAKVLSGMWYGALNSFSRVRLLADDDIIVVECKRKFQERRLELGRLPLWSIDDDLTVTDYNEMDNIQFVSLMDILSYEKDDSIFCCVVRVMAIHPFQAEDLHSSAARGEHEMRLTLEDPTARIHAYLLGKELVEFFNGFPPDLLDVKMKKLLGVPEHENLADDTNFTRHPPLVKCCIDSMKDNFGNTHYYVCHTWLK